MPFAVALLASALFHIGVLVSPAWELPGFDEPPPVTNLDAVLAPAPKVPAAPVAKSQPKPKIETRGKSLPQAAAEPQSTASNAVPPAPTFEPSPPSPALAPAQSVIAEPSLPPLPASGRVKYLVIRGEQNFVVGQSVHEWQHDGKTYSLRSVTETTGLAALFKPARVVQTSRGELTSSGLKPVEFRHEKVKGVDEAHFDWERGVVAYEGKESTLPAGAQDMLSLYYQAVIQATPEQGLALSVATGRKLEPYRFVVKGEETLKLAGGEYKAMRLSASTGNDTLELWLATGLQGLPIKIRFIDRKGELFDQIVEEIHLPKPQENKP
jgi:hypothetical protein